MTSPFRRALALLLWLAVCAPAQAPFRVDVKLVGLAASVRDASGALVTGLSKEDFEVLEDGAPQRIAFFSAGQESRLNLGLLVDFSGSQDPFIKSHHKDLETFLQTVLGPADRVFLLCFGNRLRMPAGLTESTNDVLEALRSYEKGRREYPVLGPAEDRTGGTAFYDAIYHSVEVALDPLELGRKALILFSDGEDNSSAHHMMDALEEAQNGGVVLFGVRYTDIKNGKLNARNKYGASVMARLAHDTGGADFDARKGELAAHFKAIADQLRASYDIAYHSTNPGADGAFRKVTVRVNRPGLTVSVQSGYYAR
jgi:Ca-activated chloride channel homolog